MEDIISFLVSSECDLVIFLSYTEQDIFIIFYVVNGVIKQLRLMS